MDLRVLANTLSEIAQTLATTPENQAEAIQHSLLLLRRIVPYDRCGLKQAGPTEATLAPAHLAAAERARLAKVLDSLLSRMQDEDGEPAGAPGEGFARLAVPVLGPNQIAGVLFVERAGMPYDEDSLRILSIVASQLGAWLTNLRLREDDVEHARQLGIALHRLEEMDRRKDDFLAMLGHELRNPLGAINNAIYVLGIRSATDEWMTRYRRIIDRQINHLSRIVDDLLDASRVRLGKINLERRPVDLCSVVQRWHETFGMMPQQRTHHLEFDLPETPVMVLGDPVRLEQILANLLTNALKYTPPGGRIAVSVARETSEAVVHIRDSGIGISPEILPRVFDLFTQADESLARSQGGLGLGLSLVRSLVEMHGGRVEAQSTLGVGSDFMVRLPLQAVPAEPVSQERASPSAAPALPLRVLVLEDNDDGRVVLEAMLQEWRHEVQTSGNGTEGLALALTSLPDVMLIDIGLPGLDGYEVARRIRRELVGQQPHLIAMTGYGQPETRRRVLDVGFDAYMVKPFEPQELQARLAQLKPRK
jgi:two-component system, sensor histidine kinase